MPADLAPRKSGTQLPTDVPSQFDASIPNDGRGTNFAEQMRQKARQGQVNKGSGAFDHVRRDEHGRLIGFDAQ